MKAIALNRFMAIVFLIALSISLLFSTSTMLSALYTAEALYRSIKVLDTHAFFSIVSTNESLSQLMGELKNISSSMDVIDNVRPILFIKKFRVNKPIPFYIYGTELNATIPKDYTIYVVTVYIMSNKAFIALTPKYGKSSLKNMVLLSYLLT